MLGAYQDGDFFAKQCTHKSLSCKCLGSSGNRCMSTALRKKMHQDLQLAGLSEGTQDVYLRAVRRLAVHFDTPPDVLNEAQVRDYLLHLKNDRKLASSSLSIAYCAIKFFYSHTAPRDWPTLQRIRVQKEKRLPDVLSIDEVRELI